MKPPERQRSENTDSVPGWPSAAARLARLALLAVVATVPFATEPLYMRPTISQTYYLEWAGLSVGILVMATILALRLPLPQPTVLFWCYLAYLAVICISIVLRPVPGYGFAIALLPLTGAVVLFILEVIPTDQRRQEQLFLLLVGLGLASAAYGVLQNFGVELFRGVAESERQVLSSFFGHSNFMASFAAPVLFLAAYFLSKDRERRLRLFAAAAVGVTLICLYWAGTRAAALGVVAGALSLTRWRRAPKSAAISSEHEPRSRPAAVPPRKAAIVSAIVVLGLLAVLWGQYGGRHRETLMRRLTSHRELSNRAFLWLVSIEMIHEKPIWGIGYGRYDAEFWPYCERYVRQPGNEIFAYVLRGMQGANPGEAHNDLLEVACETGAFGAAAFLALWVLALAYCHKCIRQGAPTDQRMVRYVRAALICFFLDSLFGFPLQLPASAVVFWLLLGTLAQTYRRLAGESLEDFGTKISSRPIDLSSHIQSGTASMSKKPIRHNKEESQEIKPVLASPLRLFRVYHLVLIAAIGVLVLAHYWLGRAMFARYRYNLLRRPQLVQESQWARMTRWIPRTVRPAVWRAVLGSLPPSAPTVATEYADRLRRVLEIFPYDGLLQLDMSKQLLERRQRRGEGLRPDQAFALLDEALAHSREALRTYYDVEAYSQMAWIHMELQVLHQAAKHKKEAEESLRAAIEGFHRVLALHPDNVDALEHLTWIYSSVAGTTKRREDWLASLEYAKRLLEVQHDNTNALYFIGIAYENLEVRDRALTFYSRTLIYPSAMSRKQLWDRQTIVNHLTKAGYAPRPSPERK